MQLSLIAGLENSFDNLLQVKLSPPIAGATKVKDLLPLMSKTVGYETKDEIFSSLITRIDQSSDLREVIIHLMKPALINLSRSHQSKFNTSFSEAFSLSIFCLYETLEEPSIREKKSKVAARLRWETQSKMTQAALKDSNPNELPIENATFFIDETKTSKMSSTSKIFTSQLNLLEALAWARDEQIITLEEVHFLLAIYSPDTGITLEDLNLSDLLPGTIRKRASRLAQRISKAITTTHHIDSILAQTGN